MSSGQGEVGSSLEDQEKLLEDAVKRVKRNAFDMKRCLDQSQVMDGINHAGTMLEEMRTALLSPKSYYMLYMNVSDELMHLNQFLVDEYGRGNRMPDLYELVQYCGNIVPRLYLLVTVGTAYIKVREGSRKNILRDLVEMCRGVQHPLRGLFLRNYLLQCTRLALPDAGQDRDQYGDGSVEDSIEFIHLNFGEMNKLWVRMQYQGHSREKEKREKERLELRVLVGTNLVRLSDLQGIDADCYKRQVFPGILDQVVQCRDPISQEYLLECVISVFPDEFHLQTLQPLLKTCQKLHERVAIRKIVVSLLERLIKYSENPESGGIPSDIELFDIFSSEVSEIIQNHKNVATVDGLAMLSSVLNLALTVYPAEISYVDQLLAFCLKCVQSVPEADVNNLTLKELLKLLKVPVDAYNDILTILKLETYPPLMARLGYQHRKDLSVYLCQNLIDTGIEVPTPQEAEDFLALVESLTRKQSDQPEGELDPEDFSEEQNLVGQVVHRLVSPINDQQYHVLTTAKKHFSQGGEERQRFTYPSLAFAAMKLVRRYYADRDADEKWEKKLQHIFQFLSQLIHSISSTGQPELALRLFVQAALCADRVCAETIAYEFVSQAFMIYEEEISDSKAQMSAVNIIIGMLEQMGCLGEENHETLRSKCAVTSNKLLRKSNQCRAVALCSNLFWTGRVSEKEGPLREGQRVVECLRKALKIANQCMEAAAQAQLFIEVLNWYLYYYEQECDSVTIQVLEQLIRKINDSLPHLGANEEAEQIHKHFQLTIQHIVHKQKLGEGAEAGPNYAKLKII